MKCRIVTFQRKKKAHANAGESDGLDENGCKDAEKREKKDVTMTSSCHDKYEQIDLFVDPPSRLDPGA